MLDENLSGLERILLDHLYFVLSKNYNDIYHSGSFKILMVGSTVPTIKLLYHDRIDLGLAVFTSGLVSYILALSARFVSLVYDGSGHQTYGIRRSNVECHPYAARQDDFKIFQLDDGLQRASGLSKDETFGLVSNFSSKDRATFIEVFCASMEFLVLHEAGHLVARHTDAAKMIQEEVPQVPMRLVNRIFEHQADYCALKLMFTRAPFRPGKHGARLEGIFDDRESRKNLAFYAAAISLTAIAFLQSAMDKESDGLEFQEISSSGHPVASGRLLFASLRLGENDIKLRISRWGLGATRAFDGTEESSG